MEKYLIPFRDISLQYKAHKDEIDDAVQKVLSGGRYIGGETVERFEQSLANYLGVKYVISCANGTDALRIALMATEDDPFKKGRRTVLTSCYSFVSAVEAAVLHGDDVEFCDVDESGNMNVNSYVEGEPISDVVIPVHLFGRPCNMQLVENYVNSCKSIYNKHPIIIEDNAQSLGAWYRGRKAGAIGDVGITSFFPTKNLACFGDGGALFTNDDRIAGLARMIRNHGRNSFGEFLNTGLNSRLDAIQAAILNVNLKYLDEYNLMRMSIAREYDFFRDTDGITIPLREDDEGIPMHTYNHYTVKLESEKKRNSLLNHLLEEGIEARIYYPKLINKESAYCDINNGVTFPVAEILSSTTLSLPIYPYMRDDQANAVIYTIDQWCNGNHE